MIYDITKPAQLQRRHVKLQLPAAGINSNSTSTSRQRLTVTASIRHRDELQQQ